MGAAGWHLAAALNAADFHVARAPADARPLTLCVREMPDGSHRSRRRETLIRFPSQRAVGLASALLVRCVLADQLMIVGDLVARYGSKQTLIMLVPRLRCKTCRRPLSDVVLRNKYPAQMGDACVRSC